MIYKNPVGISPSYEIAIDGVSVDYLAISVLELHLEVNLHDMLVITMSGIPTRAISDYRDRPVFCNIDLGAGYSQSFHGYITEIRPKAAVTLGVMNYSPFQTVDIVCLGTSYEMRGSKSRLWSGYTLSNIVSELSAEHKFSFDAPKDPFTFSPIIQDRESDWQFIVRYANSLGYDVTLNGTHLHVFDPYKAASRQISYNKLLTEKTLSQARPHPGHIHDMTISAAERNPDGVYLDAVVTVHQEDDTVFDLSLREVKGLRKRSRFSSRINDVVDTYEQAERALLADSKKKYDLTAEMTVMGIPGCKPGGVVDVDKYGGEASDGLWYVSAVSHRLHSSAFVSKITAHKNHRSPLVDARQRASIAQAPPAPSLQGDRWLASKRVTNVYT